MALVLLAAWLRACAEVPIALSDALLALTSAVLSGITPLPDAGENVVSLAEVRRARRMRP